MRVAELEGRRGLHDLAALHLWRPPALPTMVGCNLRQKQLQQEQHLQKAVQALGTHLAEGSGLGV